MKIRPGLFDALSIVRASVRAAHRPRARPMATTLTLSKAEADAIAPGTTRCITVGGAAVIAHKSRDGAHTCAPNVCQHMSAGFSANADIEDSVLVCPMHGACLDASTMTYKGDAKLFGLTLHNLSGSKQPVYTVKANRDGSLTLRPPVGSGEGLLSRLSNMGSFAILVTAILLFAPFAYFYAPPGALAALRERVLALLPRSA